MTAPSRAKVTGAMMIKAMKVLMAKRSDPLMVFMSGFERTPRVAKSTFDSIAQTNAIMLNSGCDRKI